MTATWDTYLFSYNSGTLVIASGATATGTEIIVADNANYNATSVPVGDSIDDSDGIAPPGDQFVGSGTVNGVTGYFVQTDFGHYDFFVLSGSPSPAASGDGQIPLSSLDTTDAWNLECFAAGTLIATPEGDRAVETLAAGDLVLNADGIGRPVRWLGRSTRARLFADPTRVFPIRIKAGALGDSLPRRDLLLSPGHAVLIDGVLVQAAALVNGTSIVRETPPADIFTYYHVELDGHDLLLAEGVASESFLLGGEDMGFENLAERPTDLPVAAEMAYPRVKASRQVPASVRGLIAARAGKIAAEVAAAA